MTINFYLERNQNIKSDERAIYCYIRGKKDIGGEISFKTNQKINLLCWDKEKQRAIQKGVSKYQEADKLNEYLEDICYNIRNTMRISNNGSMHNDYFQIKNLILEKFSIEQKSKFGIFDTIDSFIEIRTNELSPETCSSPAQTYCLLFVNSISSYFILI